MPGTISDYSDAKEPVCFSHISQFPVLLDSIWNLMCLVCKFSVIDDYDVVHIEEEYDASTNEQAGIFRDGLET